MVALLRTMRSIIQKASSVQRPAPQGRWALGGDVFLRAEYATRDSCGDSLCGHPTHYQPEKQKRGPPTNQNLDVQKSK